MAVLTQSSIGHSHEYEKKDVREPIELPHNMEAEQALLGSVLSNNQAFDAVADFVTEEHFYYPAHGKIFRAIQKLLDKSQVATPITLKAYFTNDEELEVIGGAEYLAQIASATLGIASARDYGKTVYDLYLKRSLISIGQDVIYKAHNPELGSQASELIESTEQNLFNLATSGLNEATVTPFNRVIANMLSVAESAYQREGTLIGLPTGLLDLDKLLGGLCDSDLLILAARPSMGKTAIALNMATNICVHLMNHHKDQADQKGKNIKSDDDQVSSDSNAKGVPGVAFFSLEMSAEQLAMRIISDVSNLSSDKIRRGQLDEDGFRSLVNAGQEISTYPLYIDDTPALTISAFRTRARRLKRQKNIAFIVVDYLQLLNPSPGRRNDNRVQEISEITRGLKAIAKELSIPILAASQLSRAVEQREDKRPQLSDLRESGSIEQDADIVLFLFREEYYLQRSEPMRRADEAQDKFNERYLNWKARLEEVTGVTEVIVAKHRQGPVGSVRLSFMSDQTRFGNLARSTDK